MIVEALLSAFARTIASRNEQSVSHAPSFVSAVFVTVSVGFAATVGTAANVSPSKDPQATAKKRPRMSSSDVWPTITQQNVGCAGMLLAAGPPKKNAEVCHSPTYAHRGTDGRSRTKGTIISVRGHVVA